MVLVNSIAGGATQGIKEMIMTMPKKRVKFYLIFPEQPDTIQEEWLIKNVSGYKCLKLDWWNLNQHLPIHLRIVKSALSNVKSVLRLRNLVTLYSLIRDWKINIVYTATSLNLEGAIISKITGKPHVWHLKETFGVGGRVKFMIPDRLVPIVFLTLSSRILVMTNYIRGFFGPSQNHEKIFLLYDSVSIEKFKVGGKKLRKHMALEENELLVAMVASLSSVWKQHEIFIHAVAMLKDKYPHAKFAIFGPEPQEYANEIYNTPWYYFQSLKGLARELNLEGSLLWGGFYNNVPELMSGIDVLVHTCDSEPFGRIIIEGMAAGKAVVGPDKGGVAETIDDGETGLLAKAGSPTSFASMIEILINDQKERVRLGGNAQKMLLESHFNQEFHNQKMLEIFTSLI